MEFDRYGRLKNPGISSTRPVNDYTHVQNTSGSHSFFLWDWFNNLVIGIGNFIASSTETIIGFLAGLAMLGGAIFGIVTLIDVWSHNSFIAALLITIIGGGIVYYVFMIVLGILYWIVALALAIIRYIFYNGFTLLLAVGLVLGYMWYNRDASHRRYEDTNTSSLVIQNTTSYRCTARTLNVRLEPNTASPIVGKLYKGDIVEVYDVQDGFAHIKYGEDKAWASLKYLKAL